MEKKETQDYTALGALEKALGTLGHSVAPGELKRQHPELRDKNISWKQLEVVAKSKKMKAKFRKISLEELREMPAPIISRLNNGQFIMIGAHNDESVMFLDLARDKAVALPTIQFGQIWTGRS